MSIQLNLTGVVLQDRLYNGLQTVTAAPSTSIAITGFSPPTDSAFLNLPNPASLVISQISSPNASVTPYSVSVSIPITFNATGIAMGLNTKYSSNATGTFSVTILKAPLSITAVSDTKIYGDADPVGYNGVLYDGFVNGETAAVLPVLPTVTRTQSGEDVGSYTLTASLSQDPLNYLPTFVQGAFQISQKTLPSFSVAGVAGDGKIYDTNSTATTTGNPTASGLLGTDGVIAVMKANATNFVDSSGNPISAAGTHSIAGVVALSGAKAGNYTPQESSALFLSAQKIIAKANLPVTGLNAQSKVADGTTAMTITGIPTIVPLGSDIVTVDSYAAAFPSNAVGCYNITGSVTLGGTASGNYTGSLTFTNVCITGAPAAPSAPIPVRNAERGNAAVMNDRKANAFVADFQTPVAAGAPPRKPASAGVYTAGLKAINASRFIR